MFLSLRLSFESLLRCRDRQAVKLSSLSMVQEIDSRDFYSLSPPLDSNVAKVHSERHLMNVQSRVLFFEGEKEGEGESGALE